MSFGAKAFRSLSVSDFALLKLCPETHRAVKFRLKATWREKGPAPPLPAFQLDMDKTERTTARSTSEPGKE